MRSFLEILRGEVAEPIWEEIDFDDKETLEEAALHPSIGFLKQLMQKRYGLTFKVTLERGGGTYRFTGITRTGVPVGFAEHTLRNLDYDPDADDPSKRPTVILFGTTSGMFMAHDIDYIKKEIEKELYKKFPEMDLWTGGMGKKKAGKERAKQYAQMKSSYKK